MDLRSYDMKDPELLIREIAGRVRLTEDTAFAVLVRDPSTSQQIVEIRRLDSPALLDNEEWRELREELRDAAEALRIPDTGRCRHSIVTVLVRPGRTILGPNELVWSKAWRYSNHFQPAFNGGIILVTEHGWLDFDTMWAGHEPRMVS